MLPSKESYLLNYMQQMQYLMPQKLLSATEIKLLFFQTPAKNNCKKSCPKQPKCDVIDILRKVVTDRNLRKLRNEPLAKVSDHFA